MARLPVHVFAADPLTGNALASVSCLVKNRATGASASLWDAEVAGSSVSNPLTTNSNGRAFAWTDSAALQIDYSGAGITAYSEYRAAPIDFVSALPGSPYDTQEVYYQSASMATLGIAWHLRYRLAASGSYKWEFLGGPPLTDGFSREAAKTAAVALTYYDFTAPISVAVPLAGDYMVSVTGNRVQANTTYSTIYGSLVLSSGTATYAHNDQAYAQAASQYQAMPISISTPVTAISAAGTVGFKYTHNSTTQTVDYVSVSLSVQPLRVG